VLDFDGVFTDNRASIHQDGSESVWVSRADGMGISQLRKHNFPMVVTSTERNPVVAARCEKLNIECLQGIDDKLPVLTEWAARRDLSLSHIAYAGNDINDVECMRAAGTAIAPADAHPSALEVADIVLTASGGYGAVREISDSIIKRFNNE
jgi:N-acylneuraminate cytidylyltransferase